MRTRKRTLLSLIASATAAISAFAGSDERTISFYHIHTKETLSIVYKRNGQFVPEAMTKIDWLMRDWRKNTSVRIDPEAVDIIWEMHRELGSSEPVHVICGHRSPATNEHLRRTNGGQAKHSEHITGKAIDIAFPDVPVKQLRYSAMIREQGGVGYYPTSGIPFVHVDTGRVRSWPNMARDELALLFPSGRSKHRTADGGYITPADVARARERSPGTALQIATFFEQRERQRSATLVADAGRKPMVVASTLTPPAPQPAVRRPPPPAPEQKMALAAPLPIAPPAPAVPPRAKAPKLVAEPKLIERPARFTRAPSKEDRSKLAALVAEAQRAPAPPQLVKSPSPAERPARPLIDLDASPAVPPDDGSSEAFTDPAGPSRTAAIAAALLTATDERWAQAPEFDEDHPEELSYRPFPLAPILTATASADDPALTQMVHPDAGEIFDMVDDTGGVLPMRFRPGEQLAAMIWSKEFRGEAVDLSGLQASEPRLTPPPPKLAERRVKTSIR